MSKAVRWQVPFAAHDGTRYRVDIYDEGYTGNPVVLTAGETPFTTDEDDSDDFFAPVRTQTGTLQVCTDIEGSNTPLKLEDILPANNIARPVRLLKYANGSYSVIEWQGFLSCEAYSQDYIGIPQNLDLPLIGVLEAMDSVPFPASEVNAQQISRILFYAMEAMDTTPLTFFTDVYYSGTDWAIFQKQIDRQHFYEVEEIQNTNSVSYTARGVSCKNVLEQLCQLMGWTVREKAQNIYFERIGETNGMIHETRSNFFNNVHTTYEAVAETSKDISTLDWMGKGHQKSITQGARRIELNASVKNDEDNIELPDYPFSNPTSEFGKQIKKPFQNGLQNITPLLTAEQDTSYYSNIGYGYVYGTIHDPSKVGSDIEIDYGGQSNKSDFLQNLYLNRGSIPGSTRYSGATLVNISIPNTIDGFTTIRDYRTALYCSLLPNLYGYLIDKPPIFTIKSKGRLKASSATTCRLKISFSAYYIGYKKNSGDVMITDNVEDEYLASTGSVAVKVRFGNKYYDGSGWTTWPGYSSAQPCFIPVSGYWKCTKEIPIDTDLSGVVEIGLMPYCFCGGTNAFFEIIFTDFKAEIEYSEDSSWSDRDENKYIRLLSTKFRDEVSVDLDLATNNNNRPCPSIILGTGTGGTIPYVVSGGTENRRPEVDLLNRLATYYGAARQRLELEVAHITTPLPNLKLNGINDGKVYLPLAESRDWRTGVCKLTCFECPS